MASGGFDVLWKVLGFAVDAVSRVAAARDAPDGHGRSSTPPLEARRAAAARRRATQPARDPLVVVEPKRHMWCVTRNRRGRGQSAEHCAYCGEDKTAANADALCSDRE